jgi:hypothetical protein
VSLINKGSPNGKLISLEKLRETWLRQVVLHRDAPASVIKVAVIVGYHINRKTGLAFPGMRTIAKLTSLSTSTINKAVKWLQTFGYLEIQPGKTRNATNRYLPILNQGANKVFASERTGCSPQGATDLPTYLPKEPPSCKATTNVVADNESQEVFKGSEERGIREGSDVAISVSPSLPEQPDSPEKEAYRLAREYEGELGASRVARALNGGSDPSYVLADVAATVEDGGDLGEALSYHWKGEW